jgi:uncharacterized integral membrane protein
VQLLVLGESRNPGLTGRGESAGAGVHVTQINFSLTIGVIFLVFFIVLLVHDHAPAFLAVLIRRHHLPCLLLLFFEPIFILVE